MKSKYKGKTMRTSGWETQPEFDIIISDLDISSLRFMKHDYNKQIRDFGNQRDLLDEVNIQKYQELLQRKKMVTEELEHREMDLDASPDFINGETYFDPNTGLVINTESGPLYSISFNEEEDDYIYNNGMDSNDDDEINIKIIRQGPKVIGYVIDEMNRDRTDIYKNWNYYEDLDE